MGADLHLHTTASDGSVRPAQIVQLALQAGLDAIAITDHDTFDGIEQAKAQSSGLQIIPGIELSCDINGIDVHILAYWLDYKAKWLNDELERLRKGRYERAQKIVQKLNENGFDIEFDDILNIAGDAALGRSHVARVMLQKGFVDNIQEAFDRYLGKDSPCYVSKPARDPDDIFKLVTKAGGVTSLAHPASAGIDEFIPDLIKKGLTGIEVYHPDHSPDQVKFYEDICRQYNVVPTAGSDFHAHKSKRGTRIGTYKVDMAQVERLKERLPSNMA